MSDYWEQSLREAVEHAIENGKTLAEFMQHLSYELDYGTAAKFAANEKEDC